MLLGAHVSKTAGSLDLQRDALRVAGVDDAVNLYHDFASRPPRRPAGSRQLCLCALTEGGVLVVWKLDRLGRNRAHLVQHRTDLSARGVACGCSLATGRRSTP